MGIWSDIKKAAKGSKEYQKRKKGPISKAVKQVAKDVKSAVKGSKKYQERKKGPISKVAKQVSKDVKSAIKGKKAAPQPFGKAFSSARKAGKKTFTWKGKSYSTKTADDVKKEKATKAPKKVAPKKVAKPAPSGPESPVGKKEYEAKPGQESTMQRNRPKKTVIEPYPPREDQGPKFAEGGKVESNPYGWPSTDARGKK